MATLNDITMVPEEGAITRVICKHCGQEVGRVETVPRTVHGEEAQEHAEETLNEIQLIADEHFLICPKRERQMEDQLSR